MLGFPLVYRWLPLLEWGLLATYARKMRKRGWHPFWWTVLSPKQLGELSPWADQLLCPCLKKCCISFSAIESNFYVAWNTIHHDTLVTLGSPWSSPICQQSYHIYWWSSQKHHPLEKDSPDWLRIKTVTNRQSQLSSFLSHKWKVIVILQKSKLSDHKSVDHHEQPFTIRS